MTGRTNPRTTSGLTEKVVFINRCAKVVKGGRRFSFSALIVAGDKLGKVGCGFGKANEVSEAIRKASESAKKAMVKIAVRDNTIPHEVIGEHGGGRVLLRPASPGTGVIAGGGVRAVVEAAGIRDVLAKSLGSSNHANVVKATLGALQQLRLREEIFKTRGIADQERANGCLQANSSYEFAHSQTPSRLQAPGQAPRLRRKQRPRQDLGQRPQGPEGPLRRQHPPRLRRRPDAAHPPHPEARLQQRHVP